MGHTPSPLQTSPLWGEPFHVSLPLLPLLKFLRGGPSAFSFQTLPPVKRGHLFPRRHALVAAHILQMRLTLLNTNLCSNDTNLSHSTSYTSSFLSGNTRFPRVTVVSMTCIFNVEIYRTRSNRPACPRN